MKNARKKNVMSGGKSNSEKEDKRDREERKVRAGGRENVEMRGVDLLWLDSTSVRLRSKRGSACPSCCYSLCSVKSQPRRTLPQNPC